MKRWLIYIPFLLLACNEKVVTFVNDQAAFNSYFTYRTVNYKVNKDEIPPEGRMIFDQIEKSISSEMNRRNYELSNLNPDLLIRYEIISNQVTDVTMTNAYPYYYTPIVTSRTFLESALLLEMTDTQTQKMVWQASMDMSQYDSNKRKQGEIIQEAVVKLFNTYLYKAGSLYPDESIRLDL